jgi:Xaa-Pro aminopeptidase
MDGNGTYGRRVDALRSRLTATGAHALIVAPGSDLAYLSGYHALPLERPTLLIVRSDGPVALVAPLLERARAREEVLLDDVELHCYGELDDPFALTVDVLLQSTGPFDHAAPRRDDHDAGAVGERGGAQPAGREVLVGEQMWAGFLLQLQKRSGLLRWSSASAAMAHVRRRKDDEELRLLARVALAIDAVHARVPDVLRAGRTEREVADELAALIREDHDTVDFVIVASGPNSASPHHEPGPRTIVHGDAVVVDIGGSRDGYRSDMTRTYVIGEVPEGFADAYVALQAAHAAAVAAVRPGVTAGAVDAAAREVLDRAGLGDAFVHRTGHGIGLDTHEAPWIVAGSDVVLEPGMTFSIEPGFYLEGRHGARIEDIVAVTPDGVDVLNDVPRDLVVIA